MIGKDSARDEQYIIRVYTNQGRYRFQINSNEPYYTLLKQIASKVAIPQNNLQIFTQTGKQLNLNPNRKIKQIIYLKNGAILKVNIPIKRQNTFGYPSNLNSSKSQQHFKNHNPQELLKRSKSIDQNQNKSPNSKCYHGPNIMCINCLPQQKQQQKSVLIIQEQKIKQTTKPVNSLAQSRSQKSIKTSSYKPPLKPSQPNKGRIFNNNIPKNSLTNSRKSILSPKESKLDVLTSTYKSIQIPKPKQKSKQVLIKCNHGSNSKCINCIQNNSNKKEDESTNKCNHGQHSKCLNCIKKQQKIAHVSFDEYLNRKKVNCSKNHPKEYFCPNCLPIKNVRLTMKANCPQHPAFPGGMCIKCLPQNCAIKRQQYRHVDYVQFMQSRDISNFVKYWIDQKKMKEIRIGILYGYYAQDPFFPNGIRAIVQAIYEPLQKCTTTRFQILDNQMKRKNVDAITEIIKLEKIGMLIASPYEEGYFTEQQVRIIASIQQQLSVQHSTGYKLSNFFTVLVQRSKDNQPIQPIAFMISDLGQAIQSANLFIPNIKNLNKMLLKTQESPNQMLPSFYLQGKQIKQFQIQYLLVNIGTGISKSSKFAMIKGHQFPAVNRGQIKRKQIRDYLTKIKHKSKQIKYNDLNLLIYLADKINIQKVLQIGLCLSSGIQIDKNLINHIDSKLQSLA